MKIYLTRHGQTPWNKKGKIQGQVDIPLSEEGKEQARMTAEGMKDIPFDCIFVSPLLRARQTAEIIKGERDIPTFIDPRLKEIAFGILEGRQLHKLMNSPKSVRYARVFKDPEHYRAAKYGETIQDVEDRFVDFYENVMIPLEAEKKYENILVVAHGCLIRTGILYLNNRPISQQWKSPFGANCCTAIFECIDGKTEMLSESTMYYDETQNFHVGKII